MTTIYAAAARRINPRLALAVLLGATAMGLGGCESNSSLLSGNFGSSIFGSNEQQPAAETPAAPPAAQQQLAKIALAPIIGAPENVARQIQQDFVNSAQTQRVAVAANKDERVDYTLRGYLVAAKEKRNTKVSYIWDVTDPTGKRVNRVTGEEVLPGHGSKDPWAAVTPEVSQSLASKAATSFVAWLAANNVQTPVAAVAPPVAPPAAPAPPVASSTQATKQRQATASIPPPKPAATPVAEQRPTQLVALVPQVVGAPGDGSKSLSDAIRQELQSQGIGLANAPSASTYRVEGTVKVGNAKDGKQPIVIEWHVKDPKGKKLGTVSQRNEIPAGSLDGEWGSTAQQAAGAAVQGIVKLLPQKTASN